jgi:predicted  nucleic acid-binding Zn-ribbon protein
LFRGAESFQTELKKIVKKNRSLAAEIRSLEQQLADNTGSALKELQEKRRLLELEEKERLLANIPQEVINRYNDHPGQQELTVNKE